MGRIEKTVFISYRRTNFPWALAIFQDLTQHGFDVFIDYTGINSGAFETVILENIKARAHFVVLLTPSALERCGEPGDWLRREVETALEVKRNIIPLMLEGFSFGAPKVARQLKGRTISALQEYNGLEVPAAYFSEAMKRLREGYLSVPLDALLRPPSVAAQQAAKDEQQAAATAPAVAETELARLDAVVHPPSAAVPSVEKNKQAITAPAAPKARLDERRSIESTTTPTTSTPTLRERLGTLPPGSRTLIVLVVGTAMVMGVRSIVLREPATSSIQGNRGPASSGIGDRQESVQDATPASGSKASAPGISSFKPDATAFYNSGLAREAKGDPDGALKDYDEAIRLKPDFALAFYERAIARQEKGDLDGALQDDDEAVRLKPDFANAFYNRGVDRKSKGDLDGALQDYNETIRLKPDYASAFNNRGNIHKHKGDIDGAMQDYNEAIRLKPDSANAFNNRGLVRKAKGDLEGALQDYSEAIRLKPDYANAFYNRANVRRIQGDRQGTAADYQKYLDLGGGKQDGDQAAVERMIRDLKNPSAN